MIAKRIGAFLVAAVLMGGCATDKTAADTRCPADDSSVGLSLPGGLGLSVGESGRKAAFNAIREFFHKQPSAAGEADKARAADLAAAAAARDAAQPMSEEQKRALRSQAGEWVDTYSEKCRSGAK